MKNDSNKLLPDTVTSFDFEEEVNQVNGPLPVKMYTEEEVTAMFEEDPFNKWLEQHKHCSTDELTSLILEQWDYSYLYSVFPDMQAPPIGIASWFELKEKVEVPNGADLHQD